MSIYISKIKNYVHYFQFEEYENVMTPQGLKQVFKQRPMACEFKFPAPVTYGLYGVKEFLGLNPARDEDGNLAAFGAHPTIAPTDLYQAGRIVARTEGWDPVTTMSYFDTAWLGDDELEAKAIAALESYQGAAQFYVKYHEVKAPAPWPAYDTIVGNRGGTRAAKIVAAIPVFFGEDAAAILAGVGLVLEYERENKDEAAVIEACEALAAEQETVVADEAALSVVIK
jgi:hypothetical protein